MEIIFLCQEERKNLMPPNSIPCPTCEELLERLPPQVTVGKTDCYGSNEEKYCKKQWCAIYDNNWLRKTSDIMVETFGSSPSEALASMLLYLHEKGLLKEEMQNAKQ